MCIYKSLSLSLSLYIYIYIYIRISTQVMRWLQMVQPLIIMVKALEQKPNNNNTYKQ